MYNCSTIDLCSNNKYSTLPYFFYPRIFYLLVKAYRIIVKVSYHLVFSVTASQMYLLSSDITCKVIDLTFCENSSLCSSRVIFACALIPSNLLSSSLRPSTHTNSKWTCGLVISDGFDFLPLLLKGFSV